MSFTAKTEFNKCFFKDKALRAFVMGGSRLVLYDACPQACVNSRRAGLMAGILQT